jgi:hypothetical protein
MNCPHCDQKVENMIPLDRFNEINEQKKQAIEASETYKSKLVETDNLRAQIEELGKSLSTTTTAAAAELLIARAGIVDAEDAGDLMAIYQRRGGDQELSEWLANRDGLPRSARALFPAPAATTSAVAAPPASPAVAAPPAATTPAVAAPPPGIQPAANRGAANFTAAPSGFSAVDISKMSRQEYKANRAAILQSLQKN